MFQKRLVGFFRFFIAIAFLGPSFPVNGFGCECAGLLKPTIREDIEYRVSLSKVVFEGQVESFQIGLRKVFSVGSPGVVKDRMFHYGPYKVRALRVYKGPKHNSFEIVTGIGGGDCGIRLQIGAKYLIYASDDQQDYSTGRLFRSLRHTSIRHPVEKGDLCKFPGFLHQSAPSGSKITA